MIAPDSSTKLDAELAALAAHKTRWANIDRLHIVGLLLATRAKLRQYGPSWINLVAENRQFDAHSSDAGIEWFTGPFAVANTINGYLDSLRILIGHAKNPLSSNTGSDDITRVSLLDASLQDQTLAQGIRATAWINNPPEPDSNLIGSAIDLSHSGRVALVLGAGNVNSIPVLDSLHKLISCREVVLLKLNPVNDYLLDTFNNIFADFISEGFLRITSGDASVGRYLTDHAQVDSIHVTGSERTHNTIVFGEATPSAVQRKSPTLTKPITSELGGVNAVVVVPGPWTKRDLEYQASHIATAKLNNVGANCVAAQLLVLPEHWTLADRLLDLVRIRLAKSAPRLPFYPGTEERIDEIVKQHAHAELLHNETLTTLIDNLDHRESDQPLFNEEVFGPLLGVTRLPGTELQDYVRGAIDFCNNTLYGTLGVTFLIHPKTIRQEPELYRSILAELRYGTVAINVWNSAAYPLSKCPWGAYPGHTLDDIQSGIGYVHNTWMIGGITKTVLEGTFRPAPRGLVSNPPSLWPSYPWFVDDPRCLPTGIASASYASAPSVSRLVRLVTAAAL